jgi:ATP-binding cassette subfamily C (CFTR/MRP) protein 1
MYSWENIFLKLVSERRVAELKVLAKVYRLSVCSTTLLYFFPSLLQSATFAGAIYWNGSIELGEAFLILNIFRILTGPFTTLPSFVGDLITFLISMKRIQNFLLCDEIDMNMIKQDKDISSALQIKDGSNFHWGFEK